MNETIKKQTNLGIGFAIIGFAFIGSALVFIPKLVDEKVKSISTDPQVTAVAAVNNSVKTTTGITRPPKGKKTEGTTVSTDHDISKSEVASDNGVPNSGSWEFTLKDDFDPNAAAKQKLKTISAFMAQNKTARLQIVGMNNIRKSSKLAMKGANRIANLIESNAAIRSARFEILTEQQPDMKYIVVKVAVLGGAK